MSILPIGLPWFSRLRAPRRNSPSLPSRRTFEIGSKPVIRWIKGDGLDDPVTRTAIAQATRLFGDSVDYCICTAGLSASRVRRILEWATQPVDWLPLTPAHNPELAQVLLSAGCDPDHFGYWWKWFPERIRPDAPEWVLDGDMVITAAPTWFDAWKNGSDTLRVAQDDRWPAEGLYGEYISQVDLSLKLYSGLISLPPGIRYMPKMLEILTNQPLAREHNGCENMSEQGVVAAAFSQLGAAPIPLSEFPFARAFEDFIDYGFHERAAPVWGYHFGNAFRRDNPHFRRLCDTGVLFSRSDPPSYEERFVWLQNYGPWGRPGWSMHPQCAQRISALASQYAGRPTLEIGTSRGHLTAILASRGCIVTTIDKEDRAARLNLEGLGVEVVQSDAATFLRDESAMYELITVDLHGNDETTWRKLWPLLKPRLSRTGTLVLYNSHLWKIDEFRNETGLSWVANEKLSEFVTEEFETPPPGMIVCRYA